MNPVQAALMARYDLRYQPKRLERKPGLSFRIHPRFSSLGLLSVALVLLLLVVPFAYSSSSSQTVVQDWVDTTATAIGAFGPYQVLPGQVIAPADSELGNCFTTPGTAQSTFTISDVEFRLNGATGFPDGGQLEVLVYSVLSGPSCLPNTATGFLASSTAVNPPQLHPSSSGNLTFAFLVLPAQLVLRGATTYAVSLRIVACSGCNVANYWGIGTDSTNSVLSFRVGSGNVTSAPALALPSPSFSSYFWNGTAFVPGLPTLGSFDGTGMSGGSSGRCYKT